MELKIIREPKVYLVGMIGEHVDEDREGIAPDLGDFLKDHDVAEWGAGAWSLATHSDAELLCEVAGRICYMSFKNPRPGGNKEYIKHLLEVGHGSVLEHAVFGFIFTGISRSLSHELVRHRVGLSPSQLSQRFVDDVAFVVPPAIDGDAALEWHWQESVRSSLHAYCSLVQILLNRLRDEFPLLDRTARRKMAREAARSVLPNCTETKIFATANARALRHFIELRASLAADAEISRLAIAVLRVLQGVAPNLFGDYEIKADERGREYAETPYKKV